MNEAGRRLLVRSYWNMVQNNYFLPDRSGAEDPLKLPGTRRTDASREDAPAFYDGGVFVKSDQRIPCSMRGAISAMFCGVTMPTPVLMWRPGIK
jgi:hypothetical protein